MRNHKESRSFERKRLAPKLESRTSPVTLFSIGEILAAKGQVPSLEKLAVNPNLKLGVPYDPKKLNFPRESVVIKEPYYSDGFRDDDGRVQGLIWRFSSRRPSLVTENITLGESSHPLFSPEQGEKFGSKK